MLMLVIWTIVFWSLLFALGWRWVRRRGLLAAAVVVPAFLIGLALEFFSPPFGAYDPMFARYWIGRAAQEPDSAKKEALVRRVALQSPEYGWFIASQAIASVDEPIQRCRLRTILAGLPVRNRERLEKEAGDECNATISKGRGG